MDKVKTVRLETSLILYGYDRGPSRSLLFRIKTLCTGRTQVAAVVRNPRRAVDQGYPTSSHRGTVNIVSQYQPAGLLQN
jgi:hypothetical protein